MSPTPLQLFFGWAALLSAVATVGTLVTAALFFRVGGRMGPINDAVSVVQMVLMMPVVVVLFLLRPAGTTGLALVAAIVGGIGMVVTAVLQALLVARIVEFEQTIRATLSAGALVGVWLILANVLALGGGVLPTVLAAFGIAAGVGYLVATIGFYAGGQQHPLFYVGSALMVVGYPVWASWLGWLLHLGRVGW